MAVVFPRPPPTHNVLTTSQRSQLLRTNAKLGQVLGSTPYILDDLSNLPRVASPERMNARHKASKSSARNRTHENFDIIGRGSIDSTSSSCASSCTATSSLASHHSASALASGRPSERPWHVRFPTKRPPILRIGKLFRSSKESPGSARDDTQGAFDNEPAASSSLENDLPPATPNFAIQSEAAMRRQKMRRLTKKLGEGVPVHLVFPPTIESDEDEVIVDSPTSESSSISQASEVDLVWERYIARRSRFVQPPKTSSVVTSRYVVHYQDLSGVHGLTAETFQGLKCRTITTIPEE